MSDYEFSRHVLVGHIQRYQLPLFRYFISMAVANKYFEMNKYGTMEIYQKVIYTSLIKQLNVTNNTFLLRENKY
jgi:hypothetical protein